MIEFVDGCKSLYSSDRRVRKTCMRFSRKPLTFCGTSLSIVLPATTIDSSQRNMLIKPLNVRFIAPTLIINRLYSLHVAHRGQNRSRENALKLCIRNYATTCMYGSKYIHQVLLVVNWFCTLDSSLKRRCRGLCLCSWIHCLIMTDLLYLYLSSTLLHFCSFT